jgi:hypothetical protein
MTTSIRSMSIIAIFAAAAIVPVASAGASVNQPVLAGYSSGAPVDTSSGTSSVTALSHDYSSTPVDKSSGNSSLTSLSHDYSATPVETSSATSSLTALSHDSSPTVALHRDGSKAVPVVADLGPEPTSAAGDGFDWGDAAIGAGAVLLVSCLAILAAAGLSGRRKPTTAASQSA